MSLVDRLGHQTRIAALGAGLAVEADARASMGEPRVRSESFQGEDGFTYRITVIVEVSP